MVDSDFGDLSKTGRRILTRSRLVLADGECGKSVINVSGKSVVHLSPEVVRFKLSANVVTIGVDGETGSRILTGCGSTGTVSAEYVGVVVVVGKTGSSILRESGPVRPRQTADVVCPVRINYLTRRVNLSLVSTGSRILAGRGPVDGGCGRSGP